MGIYTYTPSDQIDRDKLDSIKARVIGYLQYVTPAHVENFINEDKGSWNKDFDEYIEWLQLESVEEIANRIIAYLKDPSDDELENAAERWGLM